MKVDDNPFLGDQNMVDVGIFKGKTKVLTLAKSRKDGTVDPKMQISANDYREIKKCHDQQKSRYEQGGRQRMERRGHESHLGSC